MFAPKVVKAVAALREGAARAAWTQWGAVFSVAASKRQARAIVDPEALLLGSLALSEHEPRLRGVVGLWGLNQSRLLSVQRAKNLAVLFPAGVRERLGAFAQVAMMRGGDARWRSLTSHAARPAAPPQREREATPLLEGGAPLMLRLRLGIGVGIKADDIAYLIGMAGGGQPVILIARATAYHGRAVRRALEELAAGGFVEARPTAPASYRVNLPRWAELLAIDPDDPPAWRSWGAMYAFVAAMDQWSLKLPAESDFVLASEARDIMLTHGVALDGVVRLPRLDLLRGEAFLEPFIEALGTCVEYLDSVV